MANEVEIILKATDKASATMKGFGANVKGSFTELSSVIGLAGRAFGAVQGVINETVGYTMNLAKQIRTLKTDIGATPEEASKLIEVAGDMGVEFGSLETALKGAIRKGIEPTIQGIGELSDAYLALAPGVDRTKFLMDNFGRSGADIARLMELGSAAIKGMGDSLDGTAKVMDEKALQAAEDYRMSLESFNDTVETAKLKIGSGLIPSLTELMQIFTSPSAASARDFINTVFKGTFLEDSMSKAARAAVEMGKGVKADTNEMVRAHTATEELTDAEWNAIEATNNFINYGGPNLQQQYWNDARAADALATNTKKATKTIGEMIDATNRNVGDAISQARKALDYAMAGGGKVQELYTAILNSKVSPEAAKVMFGEVFVQEEAIQVKLNQLNMNEAAAAIAQELGVTIDEARAKLQAVLNGKYSLTVDVFYNNVNPGPGDIRYTPPKRKATGGSVSTGGAYIVGEVGPELFVPSQSGRIVPNNQMGAAGGITINVTGINDPSAVAAAVVQRLNRAARMGAYNGRNYAGR